jgi:RNA polymerase sigma-70 factor (ECF subfamily)
MDSWEKSVALAQKGDKKAYAALLRDIVPFIRACVAPRVANQDWLDDIVQEVLISVHKSLHTYSPDRPFRPWLSSIIQFRRTDFLRKHYSARADKQVSGDLLDFEDQYVTNPAFAGEWKDVEAFLRAIPQKQRDIFILHKIEGYTAQEVANRMDMTENAVKVSVHRTMGRLKAALEK